MNEYQIQKDLKTGEREAKNRLLWELATVVQQRLREAVAAGDLPGPKDDYRVTVRPAAGRVKFISKPTLIIWSHRVAIEKGFRERLIQYAEDIIRLHRRGPVSGVSNAMGNETVLHEPEQTFRIEAFMPVVMSSEERRILVNRGWTGEQITQERMRRYGVALGIC